MKIRLWALITVLFVLRMGFCADAPAPPSGVHTKAEVDALIEKAGTAQPAWWNQAKLEYPPTLDLSWNKAPGGWDTNKNLGQYVWSVINENPAKWKDGAKLVHHTLTVNQKDPAKLKQSMDALAKMYHDLLQDPARAAYWWRKAGSSGCGNCPVGLADCYWKLGNRDMALEVLTKFGQPQLTQVIRAWAEVGEYDKAYTMSQDLLKSGRPGVKHWGNLLAGDVCRLAGKYKEAMDFYQKAIAPPIEKGNDKNVERAKAALDAVKCYELLDLKKIPDGVYKNGCYGYDSIVTVAVTVKNHKIEDVKVVDHHEKQYYASMIETPQRIIQKQGVKGVESFASATMTSEAIIQSTAKALSGGMK